MERKMAKKKYVTPQLLDQLLAAVRQRDWSQFHAILAPLKAALPIEEHPDFVEEVFDALWETNEWSDYCWEEQLKRKGYSAAQIAAVLEEDRQFDAQRSSRLRLPVTTEGGTAFGSPRPAEKKKRGGV
jgi:hypothetical protein